MSAIKHTIKSITGLDSSVAGSGQDKDDQNSILNRIRNLAGGNRDEAIRLASANGVSTNDLNLSDYRDTPVTGNYPRYDLYPDATKRHNDGAQKENKIFSSDVASTQNDPWANLNATRFVSTSSSEPGKILDAFFKNIAEINKKNKEDPDLQKLNNLVNGLGGQINPDFLQEYASLNASGFSAGSVNTEKSFNPLTEITTLKDGTRVTSLNSFFKVADIKDASLKTYAEGLLRQDQWGAYSRAFDDLFIHALENKGMNPKTDKQEMSEKASTYIARTAQLFDNAISASGKTIAAENKALATSFMASHFGIDSVAEKLGFSKEVIAAHQKGDNEFLISEALLLKPELLEDAGMREILQNHVTDLIKDNYDSKLSHLATAYKGEGNNLGQIYGNMHSLLAGKYAEDVKKLNSGNMPSKTEIDQFMQKYGYKAGGSEYHKIDNSEIAAQTYLNLRAIEHDHQLLQAGQLTDENRMYKASQTVLRSTPYNGADHNGAFNENNSGRKALANAGMNRDLVGNMAIPFVDDKQLGGLLGKMKDLDVKLSSVDISHHGCSTGTHGGNGGVSIGDKEGLLKQVVERMEDGGEVLYNSCLIGSGTEKGASNLAITTLQTAVADKGIKVHAADHSTMGYKEDAVYDAYSGGLAPTPRKLDGVVGGYTLQEGGIDKVADRSDATGQVSAIVKSEEDTTPNETRPANKPEIVLEEDPEELVTA